MLIDSHVHLDLAASGKEEQIRMLESCREHGLIHLVHISTDEQSYLNIAPLAEAFPDFVSLAMGYTPASAGQLSRNKIKQMLEKKQICAIGEIGLDYYHNYGSKAEQRALFMWQMELALERGLPVIIHTREADEDTLAVLREFPGLKGVVHCFSSARAFGESVLELGWYVSFAGNLSYKNALILQEAAAALPLDRMLLETDAPFLSPVPLRGQKNVPWNMVHTAKFLADLKGLPYREICRITSDNAVKLFRLPVSLPR